MRRSLLFLCLALACAGNLRAQVVNPADTITVEYIIATRHTPRPLGKYHLSFSPLGYFWTRTPDDFKVTSLGIDCSQGSGLFLNIRNSVSPDIDVLLDLHKWGSTSENLGIKAEIDVWAFGAGARGVINELSMHDLFFYVQGSAYYLIEKAEVSLGGYSDDAREEGFGFGASVGLEYRASPWVSFPIEGHFLFGEPADDVGGTGLFIGVSYNWGTIE